MEVIKAFAVVIVGCIAVVAVTLLVAHWWQERIPMRGDWKEEYSKKVKASSRKQPQPAPPLVCETNSTQASRERYERCIHIEKDFWVKTEGWRQIREGDDPVQPNEYRVDHQIEYSLQAQFAVRSEEAGSLEEALRQQEGSQPCLHCLIEEHETLLVVYRPGQEKPEAIFEAHRRWKATQCHEVICLKQLRRRAKQAEHDPCPLHSAE